MEAIFSLLNSDLSNLGMREAVLFFRELLWLEASRLGIPRNNINVSLETNIPDGGVDASITTNGNEITDELIESGLNYYQIKTGDIFKPYQKANLQKELFNGKKVAREFLKSMIRNCLDSNGRYLIVCFGLDLVEKQRQLSIANITDFFRACGYKKPKVEVISINNLIGIISRYPSLISSLKNMVDLNFYTHTEWSAQDVMKTVFEIGEEQNKLINSIRNQLRENTHPVHLRILGEAGIGKTRLILEATKVEEFRSFVIYVLAEKFADSRLMHELIRNQNLQAILVIDECNAALRAYLWNNLKSCFPRIKIISIYNEMEQMSDIPTYTLQPLEEKQISKIIQSYSINESIADNWANYCGGSPRVAHMIGINLQTHTEDIFLQPSTVIVWDRFISGPNNIDTNDSRQMKFTLQCISLFKRFGYKSPLNNEAETIQRFIQNLDPQITWPRFVEIINVFRNQRILQGETTLYITPRLLHIKLWLDWWDLFGENFDLNIVTKFPQSLINWFLEMFEYAGGSEAASKQAKAFLGKDGPFHADNGKFLCTNLGARFFSALAKAEPSDSLQCLKETIGKWNREELLHFDQYRAEIVHTLEFIALWESNFQDAARLLLQLGEAETQTYIVNNASGVFSDLFILSADPRLSKSEASPETRIAILREALESDSIEKKSLAIKGCEKALSRSSWGTIYDYFSVTNTKPLLWVPQTMGVLSDAYKYVFELLESSLPKLQKEIKANAIDVLLRSATNLARFSSLNDFVLLRIKILFEKGEISKELLISTITNTLRILGNKFPDEVKRKWTDLKTSLISNNLHDKIIDFITSDPLSNMIYFNEHQEPYKKIIELAEYGFSRQDELLAEIDWLIEKKYPWLHVFAYELGRKDSENQLLNKLLEKLRHTTKAESVGIFIGGYLKSILEIDYKKWLINITLLSSDSQFSYYVPIAISFIGKLNDELANIILDLSEKNKINVVEMSRFIFGKSLETVSKDIVMKWIIFLFHKNSFEEMVIVLEILDHYYISNDCLGFLPKELIFEIITHNVFLNPVSSLRFNTMVPYYWDKITNAFVNLYPAEVPKVFERVLVQIENVNSVVSIFSDRIGEVLRTLIAINPRAIWDLITDQIIAKPETKEYSIAHLLRGNSSSFDGQSLPRIIECFSAEIIWHWIDEDVVSRAPFIASCVPNYLTLKSGENSITRELLVKYGHLDNVKKNLISNFSTESWWGPASHYFSVKKENLLIFMETEENKNVKKWISEYVQYLDDTINRERIREEREDHY